MDIISELQEVIDAHDKIFNRIEKEINEEFEENGYVTDWRESVPAFLYEE